MQENINKVKKILPILKPEKRVKKNRLMQQLEIRYRFNQNTFQLTYIDDAGREHDIPETISKKHKKYDLNDPKEFVCVLLRGMKFESGKQFKQTLTDNIEHNIEQLPKNLSTIKNHLDKSKINTTIFSSSLTDFCENLIEVAQLKLTEIQKTEAQVPSTQQGLTSTASRMSYKSTGAKPKANITSDPPTSQITVEAVERMTLKTKQFKKNKINSNTFLDDQDTYTEGNRTLGQTNLFKRIQNQFYIDISCSYPSEVSHETIYNELKKQWNFYCEKMPHLRSSFDLTEHYIYFATNILKDVFITYDQHYFSTYLDKLIRKAKSAPTTSRYFYKTLNITQEFSKLSLDQKKTIGIINVAYKLFFEEVKPFLDNHHINGSNKNNNERQQNTQYQIFPYNCDNDFIDAFKKVGSDFKNSNANFIYTGPKEFKNFLAQFKSALEIYSQSKTPSNRTSKKDSLPQSQSLNSLVKGVKVNNLRSRSCTI